jgi:hypothetical protein
MRRAVKVAISILALVLICSAWSSARADEWNKKTVVTLSDSMQVPTMVLPAGTYVFKLAESPSNRNIVQVWSADESKLLTTFIAVPNYRLQPAGKTIINFSERPSGEPEAIKEWFYPGDNFGQEFAYPKSQATKLAAANKENVLEVPSYSTQPASSESDLDSLRNTHVAEITPAAAEVEPQQQNQDTQSPSTQQPATTQTNPQSTTPAQDTQALSQEKSSELPKTASPLGLITLLGVLSLAVAFAFRVFLKRLV